MFKDARDFERPCVTLFRVTNMHIRGGGWGAKQIRKVDLTSVPGIQDETIHEQLPIIVSPTDFQPTTSTDPANWKAGATATRGQTCRSAARPPKHHESLRLSLGDVKGNMGDDE